MAFSTGRLDSSLHDSKQTDFSVSPLTLPAPCISESCIKMKIDLKFLFFTLLCGASKGLQNINFVSLSGIGTGRVNVQCFYCILEKLQHTLRRRGSTEITFSLLTRVILDTFIPLYNKKGFRVFRNILVSVTFDSVQKSILKASCTNVGPFGADSKPKAKTVRLTKTFRRTWFHFAFTFHFMLLKVNQFIGNFLGIFQSIKKQFPCKAFLGYNVSGKQHHSINSQAIQNSSDCRQYLDTLDSSAEVFFHQDSFFSKQFKITAVTLHSFCIEKTTISNAYKIFIRISLRDYPFIDVQATMLISRFEKMFQCWRINISINMTLLGHGRRT